MRIKILGIFIVALMLCIIYDNREANVSKATILETTYNEETISIETKIDKSEEGVTKLNTFNTSSLNTEKSIVEDNNIQKDNLDETSGNSSLEENSDIDLAEEIDSISNRNKADKIQTKSLNPSEPEQSLDIEEENNEEDREDKEDLYSEQSIQFEGLYENKPNNDTYSSLIITKQTDTTYNIEVNISKMPSLKGEAILTPDNKLWLEYSSWLIKLKCEISLVDNKAVVFIAESNSEYILANTYYTFDRQ